MENQPQNIDKEKVDINPQDIIPPQNDENKNQSETKEPQVQDSLKQEKPSEKETEQKELEEKKEQEKIRSTSPPKVQANPQSQNQSENQNQINEKEQKMKSDIREVLQEKSNRILLLSNELDNTLSSINSMWENCRQGYSNYYDTDIKPKINNLLLQPCITIVQETVVLIFKFLCQYFSLRMKYLKEVPPTELQEFFYIIFGNTNIVSKTPQCENAQNAEMIDDRAFYQVFKELLPDKEVENSYIVIYGNSLLKYLVEYLFQIGFADAYIDEVLTNRDDINPMQYLTISYYPSFFLTGCDKEFILKKNYAIKIMKSYVERIKFYMASDMTKNNDELIKFTSYIINNTNDRVFCTFNHCLEEMVEKYPQEVEDYILLSCRSCEYYLRMQKLDMKIHGLCMLGHLVEIYRQFDRTNCNIRYNQIENILEYVKKILVQYLLKINIFDMIFGENIHEALVQRSYSILSFMYQNKVFTHKEIGLLWELTQTKYQSISNSIITLIGQLLPEFSNEDCNSILQIVSNINFKDVNEITLKLLENFFVGNERREILLNILFKLSNELSFNKGLSKSIIIKSRFILVRLLFNKNYSEDLIKYISVCISSLKNFYLYNTYYFTFLKILEDFERNKSNNIYRELLMKFDEKVQDFTTLISFLDEKYSLFDIYINMVYNIMKLFKFFYDKSLYIKTQINNGNFDYDNLLDINQLYKEYQNYTNGKSFFDIINNSNNNNNNNNNKMDIEDSSSNVSMSLSNSNSNIINTSPNDNNNNTNTNINESENEYYIKSLINDYIKYFKNKFLKVNVLPSDEEIKYNIFYDMPITFEELTYSSILLQITDFIYSTHLRSNIPCKRKYLDYLYCLGVENQINNSDIELFYNTLSKFFSSQINSVNLHLLTDEDMEYLIQEKICKFDFKFLPLPAFSSVNSFCAYYNEKRGFCCYSKYMHKYTKIYNFEKLYGFEIIWKFYIYTQDIHIHEQSLNVLINILELSSQDSNIRNNIINRIFTYIKENQQNTQKDNTIKTGFIRCLKLIAVVNGTKFTKELMDINTGCGNNNNSSNIIEVKIKNAFFSVQENNTTSIQFYKLKKIKELKEYIISKVLCTEYYLNIYNSTLGQNDSNINTNLIDDDAVPEYPLNSLEELRKKVYDNNIIINYKNKILQNDYTLADYNIENGAILTIIKCDGKYNTDYVPTEQTLQEGYQQIRVVFENKFSEEIMKAAIIRTKGNFEDSIMYLTDPNNVANLEREIEENKKKISQNVDDIVCLEEDKINILLDVLENGDEVIGNNIWMLLGEIKYPENIVEKSVGDDFSTLLTKEKIHRLIFNLKLINSLVFDDDFCKYNKIKKEKKNSWISKFINNKLVGNILLILATIKDKNISQSQIIQIYNIFINWFYEIIFKIADFLKSENTQLSQIIADINEIRSIFNSSNNNNNNNNNTTTNTNTNNNGMNIEDEKERQKAKEKFEITNKDECINFINSLDEVNSSSLFYNIIIMAMSLNNNNKNKIIENICEILLIYLVLRPDNLSKFSEEEKKNCFILKLFSTNEINEPEIRKIVINFIKTLFKNCSNKNNELFNILFTSFNKLILTENILNEHFYEIYGYLLSFRDKIEMGGDINLEPPIEKLLDNVYSLSSNLPQGNIFAEKKIMFEIYILCCCHPYYDEILRKTIDKMANENKDILNILYICLFEISRNKNKCNGFRFTDNFLRKHSFNLLNIFLSIDKKYLFLLLPKILSHHSKLDQIRSETPLDVNIRDASKEKLIGLRNFGATCYLNSLFQQMFMIPTFRRDLLSFNIEANEENNNLRNSVIYNMQITFTNLLMGGMSPYPPFRFINSFKSAFNGEPIQFGIQQDSDEFLAILCENLEKEAKTYKNENFLENSFKGKISNEIVSLESEYPYYSQSEEPFYRVTLDIKGHKTLEEALDAYVKGEVLDGDNKYFVDKYKKKISIRKSISLKKLANQIIIHLKRFEFDFVTFSNNKLNDYLKFPLEINFKKWTRAFIRTTDTNLNINKEILNITKEEEENLIDEKMNYILTGILVHGGSSLQSGHYYSFIMDQETGKWHQFNDNTISDYNIDRDLDKECFGNQFEQNNQYGRGAYLLFYTKKECFRNQKIFEQIKINDNVANDVIRENVTFLNVNNYTNQNYQTFIKGFIDNAINVLEDDMNADQSTMSKALEMSEDIYYKVLKTIKGDDDNDDDDDDEIDDNTNNQNNNLNLPENIDQIYKECRSDIEEEYKKMINDNEINIINNNNSNNNINNNSFTKKDIVKFCFFYTFGIGYNYYQNDNVAFCSLLKYFNEILKNNIGYSLWVLKQVENNLFLFTDLIFRYGSANKNLEQEIFDFFKMTFDCIFNYEKSVIHNLREEANYFVKTKEGKYIVCKEKKSITLRLIKYLFCFNLERSRTDYLKNNEYLEIFYYLVKNYSEISLICVDYLVPLISLFSNNTIEGFKSVNYPLVMMGGGASFAVHNNYIMIFSDIVLHCVTPGMINSNKYSPYFLGKNLEDDTDEEHPNFQLYPRLPPNWERIINNEIFINYILYHSYSKSKEIVCHLCYCDERTSIKILSLVNNYIRIKYSPLPFIEKVITDCLCVFHLKDSLEFIRLNTLFQLNDEDKEPHDSGDPLSSTLFEFLFETRNENTVLLMLIIYLLALGFKEYEIIFKYFSDNKEKVKWVKDFVKDITGNREAYEKFKNNGFVVLNQHNDLFHEIQDGFIKKLDLDKQ